jgi:hypothetical protein
MSSMDEQGAAANTRLPNKGVVVDVAQETSGDEVPTVENHVWQRNLAVCENTNHVDAMDAHALGR